MIRRQKIGEYRIESSNMMNDLIGFSQMVHYEIAIPLLQSA